MYSTVPVAAGFGAAIGGACALITVSTVLMIQRRSIDRELTLAAVSARREAGLRGNISIRVRARRLTVEGEVDDPSVLHKADMVFKKVPGVDHVENRIQVVSPAGHPDPEEIRRSIEESLRHHCEVEAHGIQVMIHQSRVILEGKVKSWADASEAERIAWDMPGIQEVENRLEVLA
jgi:osmotically-inducible protein OsmY